MYHLEEMADSDVSIAWSDFQNNMTYRFKQYINQKDFSDITLVTQDNKKFPAHKLILSSGSTFFRGLFSEDLGHPHPLVYLRGVGPAVLEAILQFLYQGHVQLRREQVKEFLAMAEDLGIEGLVKDTDHGNTHLNETKYSVDYISSRSVKNPIPENNAKGKTGSIFPAEDAWFKEVNDKHYDTNDVNTEIPISDDTRNELNNTELLNALCSICKVDLINIEDLKKHTQMHDETCDSPFKCTICTLGFEKEYQLKHHYNTHTDISTNDKVDIPKRGPDGIYICTVCQSAINNVSNYRKHFKRIHIKAVKSCDECDFTTTTEEGLKGHKSRKHCLPDAYILSLQKSF